MLWAVVVPWALLVPSSIPTPHAPACCCLPSLSLPSTNAPFCSFIWNQLQEETKPNHPVAVLAVGLQHSGAHSREGHGSSAATQCEAMAALSRELSWAVLHPCLRNSGCRHHPSELYRVRVPHLERPGVISAQHSGKMRSAQEDQGTPSTTAQHPCCQGLGSRGRAAAGSSSTNSHLYVLN